MKKYGLIKFVLATTALSSVILASAATVASAADVPPPRPFYKLPPPPYFTWTGFYVGAHVGGGWFDAGDGFGSVSASGFVGGGQVGYNRQIGNWVVGVEFDAAGSSASTNLVPGVSFNVNSVETLTAKGGYAFDRWLVYGKLGTGWTDVSVSSPFYSVGGTGTATAFGVGAEYALTPTWSAKVEYNILDFGSDFGSTTTFQTLKAGVNYKFNGYPF